MVTLTIDDSLGGSDTVNFIFNQTGEGPTVTLQGTVLKDVIFATGYHRHAHRRRQRRPVRVHGR